MKLILNTNDIISASRLQHNILTSVKGEIDGVSIETWSYTSSMEKFDLLFHNPPQFAYDQSKNVLFRVYTDGSNVVFSVVWWKSNPKPSEEIICLHLGRLTEMLLSHFRGEFSKLSIVD